MERRESEYSEVLKTGKSLIFRDAQNAKNSKNAANWNVSGTQPKLPERCAGICS